MPENAANTEWEIRPAHAGDAEAICALFQKAFPDDMSLEQWRWKYDRKLSHAIVVYRQGKLVAHYGGVGTEILLEGRSSAAIQVADLMVDPAARNSVRTHSPFYLSAKMFLERYVGYDKPYYLGYGFPSARAMGLSEKLGLFVPIGTMHELTWEQPKTNHQGRFELRIIDKNNFDEFENTINQLWRSFSKNFDHYFVCKKDAAFMRWRYLEHPSKRYVVYLAQGRIFKKAKFLFVLRLDGQKSMLMDVLAPALQFQPVIDAAQQISQSENANALVSWCSNTFLETFSLGDVIAKPLPVAIPANSCSPGLSPEHQKNKWWFMPGDTDYL